MTALSFGFANIQLPHHLHTFTYNEIN